MTQSDNTQTNSSIINNIRPTIWAIGGAEPLGVAADIRAAVANHVRCATIVTSVSAATSNRVGATSIEMLKSQWKSLEIKSPARVCKIGLLVNTEQVVWLACKLSQYRQKHPDITVIYEPVLVSSAGDLYIEQHTVDAIKELLLPHVDLLIVKAADMKCLTQEIFSQPQDVITPGQKISEQYSLSILIATSDCQRSLTYNYFFSFRSHSDSVTGDNSVSCADNSFVMATPYRELDILPEKSCTISSLVASLIADDYTMPDALILAKAIMSQATFKPHPLGNDRDNVFQLSPVSGFNDLPELFSFNQFSKQFTDKTTTMEVAAFAPCEANLGLYPVVNSSEWVEKLLKLGIKTIQLCCKNLTQADAEPQVKTAIALGRQYKARVFINDFWQLAIIHQAYGVHLDQEALAGADLELIKTVGLRLGISTHNVHQALIAEKLKPSYIALADIFSTSSKQMPSVSQGLAKLAFQVELFNHRCPLVAIGGISAERVTAVKATGVGAIALSSAITNADNYQLVTRNLLAEVGCGDPVTNLDSMLVTDTALRHA